MTALENIKNEFITNLLINQNKGVENIQKNLGKKCMKHQG